jgi:cytochrome c peroxidase
LIKQTGDSMTHTFFRFAAAAAALVAITALSSCASNEAAPSAKSDGPRLSKLPPIAHPANNPTSPAKVALGAQLFLDKRLSGSGNMSCQGCHYRELGWTDAKVLSTRDDGKLNTRHTPSLYNVGHQTIWYWDGRAATLEAQIVAAWRNQLSVDPAAAAAKINAVEGYKPHFQAVFGGPATSENISQALAAYLRTKNSDNSPWDRYEAGDTKAVSQAAIDGYALFMGKGRCVACHTPPHYGNSTFFNIGLEGGKEKPDVGRFNVTKDQADMSSFKTPSLRSVALGAPYFHNGSVATLKEAVKYMASGGGKDPNKSPALVDTGMTDAEIDKVVAFLNALTSTEKWAAVDVPK